MESERRSREVRERTMERSHQNRKGRGNHSSFSSSSQSTRIRNTKVSNFNESSSATNCATNNRSNAHDDPQWKPRRGNTSSSNNQKEKIKTEEDKEADSSDFPRLIGTCPFMCPGKRKKKHNVYMVKSLSQILVFVIFPDWFWMLSVHSLYRGGKILIQS